MLKEVIRKDDLTLMMDSFQQLVRATEAKERRASLRVVVDNSKDCPADPYKGK